MVHRFHRLDQTIEKVEREVRLKWGVCCPGWARPHKAPPSGHKRPLATHMRGAVLACPDQDRSHTYSVRDRPTQLSIDRKAGQKSAQGSAYVHYVSPLFPTCYGTPGGSGAGRVPIAAEQQPRPDQIHLLGNSSGDFTVAKEAPRSIKHFRGDPWSNS